MKSLIALLASATSALLVLAGCGSPEREPPLPDVYQQPPPSADELKARAVGTWEGKVTWSDAKSAARVTLVLAPAGAPGATVTPQCSSASANGLHVACLPPPPTSTLKLVGTFSTSDGRFVSTPVDAEFRGSRDGSVLFFAFRGSESTFYGTRFEGRWGGGLSGERREYVGTVVFDDGAPTP